MYQNVYSSNRRKRNDTIQNIKIGRFYYNLKLRQDSIELFFLNPFTKKTTKKSLYYPFPNFPEIKSITSTQLLMYDMVNVDDENFVSPGKKGMYYKRFDLKNNKVLLDTLVIVN